MTETADSDNATPALDKTAPETPSTAAVSANASNASDSNLPTTKERSAPASAANPTVKPTASTGRGIAWFALLVGLGAGGASGYLWYLWQQDQSNEASRVNQAIKQALVKSAPELENLIKKVAELEKLAQSLSTLRDADQALKEQLLGVTGDLQPLKNAMDLQKGETEIAKNEVRLLREGHEAHKVTTEQHKTTFAQQLKSEQARINTANKQISDLKLAVAGLNAELETLRTVAAKGGDVNAFALAEVDYLLRLADTKLKVERNVPAARLALESAQQRLKSVPEAGLIPLQAMLGENIASLRGVQIPDFTALSNKLIAMEGAIEELPLQLDSGVANIRERVKPATDVTVSTDPNTSWWERSSKAVWDQFKDIVVIRRQRIEAPPLIARENEFFLRQNLRLELENMRIALLRGDAQAYQASYQQAYDWAHTYFDTANPKVQHFLAELKALQAIQFNPYVPDLAGLNQAFQSFMTQRQPVRSLNSSAAQPPAPTTGSAQP